MKFSVVITLLASLTLASCQKETVTKEEQQTTPEPLAVPPAEQEVKKQLDPEILSTRKVTKHKSALPFIQFETVTETHTEISKPVVTSEVITKPSSPASQSMADVIKANQRNQKDIPKIIIPDE